ncbi:MULTISPECIES: sugar ABC transporter substrate-binding protein [unclassified Achromobacter]|uniref:sugar ABC transporter substrate-binding protein n=1 Tax=unclassified Achromobacter TaxID=2626865 RepID=UPI000B518FD6|nr:MULTISPECIES: sugar ABC transporter substrate-binding protein [unclassified Achromobacter]OWT67961.1 LacI family transcriptional regulator [Achromobacter sp. HZ28]OWT81019.1 LacI family transcriptional regulator [Achromobacter sp. HZ34]
MKIAVFTKNRTNPAYHGARVGAERAARQFGAEIVHFVPETPDDAAQQIALVDEALALAPDAIVMSPVHPCKVDGALRRIQAAGIPLFSLVSPVTAVPTITFVNADDYALGAAIAGYLFDRLGGKGAVLVIGGHVDSSTSTERLRGFADIAQRYPSIALLETLVGDYSRTTARSRMEQWLKTNPDQACEACLVANDAMALGVIEALAASGRSAAVVGVNAIPQAIVAIEQQILLATADYNAMVMGYLATECAARHLLGESMPPRIILPVEIVDAHNCKLWDLPYENRPVITYDDLPASSRVEGVRGT